MQDIIIQYLLNDSSYFRQVFPFIEANHFEKIEHQKIFSIIDEYYTKYKDIPSKREVITEIKMMKESELRTQIIDTFKLILQARTDIKEEFLKDKTEEYIKSKELMDFLISSAESIQKGDVDISKALQDITDISKISLQDNLGVDFTDIESRIEYYKTKLQGVSSGLQSLDRILGGGFRKKTLSVIAAPSGVGKCARGTERLIIHGNEEVIERMVAFKKEKAKTSKIPIQIKNDNIDYVNEQRMSFAKLVNEFINTIKYVNNDSLTDKEKDNAIKKLIREQDELFRTLKEK